jgi:protein-L-isoaspartate(D-aspartate) O-methyltransferase
MTDLELAQALSVRGIRDDRVLQVIASLDRSQFVPEPLRDEARGDYPLPIGHGQTISQPYIVAYMSQVLGVRPGERILEIGTGSGYQAAVLAELGAEVFSIEILSALAESSRERLERLGYARRIHLRHGDGHRGWPEEAPFDAIILTAAPDRIPDALLWQLKPGGRLLAPVGSTGEPQELVVVRKDATTGETRVERLLSVRFVPMTTHDLPA